MSESISKILGNIDCYSSMLKSDGLVQLAADLSYLVAWFKSKDLDNPIKLNKTDHLPPHSAGSNTVGVHSIPCNVIVDYSSFDQSDNISKLIAATKESLQQLLLLCETDLETTAVNAYIDCIEAYSES